MTASDKKPTDNRHALVTGGGRGIGAAIAEALHRQGLRVSLIGRTISGLEETRDRLGLKGGVHAADVADDASVGEALNALREQHGAFEVLINNAGAAESAPFRATKRDLWDRMIGVNLTGTFNVTRAALADLANAKRGRIVNVASTASLKGYAYVSAYCAAKHGVLGLTRSLALELAGTGTTVNAVCPGFTDTDLVARSLDKISEATGMDEKQALAELVSVNPQGRLIEPQEVAETVVWLLSDAARSVTGQAISVSGGEVM